MLAIYLDQNKWIDLAKAECQRADGIRYSGVLAAARLAIREGRACFPISLPHAKETAHAPRIAQRQQLANLMAELSQGVVQRTPQQLIEHSLRNAVRRMFGITPLIDEMSPFGRGFEAAFNVRIDELLPGLSLERTRRMREFFDTPGAWADLLSHSDEPRRVTTVSALKRISGSAAVAHQNDRELLKDSDESEFRRVFLSRTTLHFRIAIERALAEIGRTIQEWGALGTTKLVQFWSGISYVHAHMELECEMHRNKSRTWSANDFADLEALGVAIPSCNIVVAEKFWGHCAKQRKLDRVFNTVIMTDVAELESYLSASLDQ